MSQSAKQRKTLAFLGLGAATAAAALLLSPLGGEPEAATITDSREPRPETRPRIDAVFVLDTTGSMGGLIQGAKQKIWSIANQMVSGNPQPDVRFGLVGYRDRHDEYLTRATPLTRDLDALYGDLSGFQASGGGDGPEDVNAALNQAIHDMQWEQGQNVLRIIYLVGDAPPHDDYHGPTSHELAALAREKGIIINTIRAGNDAATLAAWDRIAIAAGGQSSTIAQDGGVLATVTPYDDELARLNAALSETAIAYGLPGDRAAANAKFARRRAMSGEVAAAAATVTTKSGTGLGRGDLVSELEAGTVSWDGVKADALPAELAGLDEDARNRAIAEKREQRREIEAKIRAVSVQRDRYVADEAKKNPARDSFDKNVLDTLREQAADIGVAY